MKRKLIAVCLACVLLAGCAVTKGTRTTTTIENPTVLDSTVVSVSKEEYEETTTYPWLYVFIGAAVVYGLIEGAKK